MFTSSPAAYGRGPLITTKEAVVCYRRPACVQADEKEGCCSRDASREVSGSHRGCFHPDAPVGIDTFHLCKAKT
ncbi:unnamed protein product [Pleuronectes platessa]|uniref:Uncharacterized protein n=1 Tax=Pleuronectes platessa TaxID=8262 RepID=A0A9N7TZM2_PLEPL|nr:unnamed protein product [Pleuronectes platessa]